MQERRRQSDGSQRESTTPGSTGGSSSTGWRRPRSARRKELEQLERLLARLTPRVWVTPSLVAANALVYGLMVASGVDPFDPSVNELMAWGALWGPAVADGQVWRVLSAGFLHIGALHVALNMWCLWSAGRLLERLLGTSAYLVVYLTSLVGGSLASLAWHSDLVAAGASGAVFGVFGSLIVATSLHHSVLQRAALERYLGSAFAFVAYNLFIGATIPGIDNAAHVGGLVTGTLAGWCLARPLLSGGFGPRSRLRWTPALGILLLTLGGAAYQGVRTAAPGGGEAIYAEAYAAYEAGELERAEDLATRAIEEQTMEDAAYLLRGFVRSRSGDCPGATRDFRQAMARSQRASVVRAARGSLASALNECGDPREAEAVASEGVALDPRDATIAGTRAWIRLGLEDWAGAIEDATRAITLDPDRADCYWVRSRARAVLKDAGAITDLRRAVELSDDPELRESLQYELAATLLDSGELDEAEATLSELPDQEHDAGFLELRATLRKERGDLEGALSDATRAIELDPARDGSHLVRGLIHLAQGDSAGAIQDLTRSIELSHDPEIEGPARFSLATALEDSGDLSSARAVVQELLALQPDRVELRTWHAWLCYRLGDAEAALAAATRAIELAPGSGRNHYLRGLAHWLSGDLRGAADDLARSIRFGLEPEDELDARRGLVQVFASAGNHRAAVEAASELVERQPAAPEPLLLRARSSLLLRDLESAHQDCTRALELDPSSDQILYLRCLVRFAQGDFESAAADAELALAHPPAGRPAAASAVLWACRARAGERVEADQRLRELGPAPQGDPWAALTSFLRGEVDEETFLTAVAERGQEHREVAGSQLATALFYAALRRWSDDDIEEAVELYRRAEAAGDLDWEWTTAVQLELDRLER